MPKLTLGKFGILVVIDLYIYCTKQEISFELTRLLGVPTGCGFLLLVGAVLGCLQDLYQKLWDKDYTTFVKVLYCRYFLFYKKQHQYNLQNNFYSYLSSNVYYQSIIYSSRLVLFYISVIFRSKHLQGLFLYFIFYTEL